MIEDPRWAASYRPVRFGAGELVADYWVRSEGGRLGIRRSDDELVVPGLLFANRRRTLATSPRPGVVSAGIEARTTARLAGVHIAAGRWRLRASAAAPGQLSLRVEGATVAHATPAAEGALDFETLGGPADISVVTGDRAAELLEVTIRRH